MVSTVAIAPTAMMKASLMDIPPGAHTLDPSSMPELRILLIGKVHQLINVNAGTTSVNDQNPRILAILASIDSAM
jgi:hypothetical protein